MEPYATPQQLIDSVPENLLADITGTEEPDVQKLQRALADASAEMNDYLAARYSLPLEVVPDGFRQKCCDIAIYRLLPLRALDAIEDARQRYEDVIRYLEKVAEGRISLGLPAADADTAVVQGVAFIAPERIMKGLNY